MARDTENDNMHRQIDENLKKVFQSKVDEELPDRFKNLLEQLRTQEAKGGTAK